MTQEETEALALLLGWEKRPCYSGRLFWYRPATAIEIDRAPDNRQYSPSEAVLKSCDYYGHLYTSNPHLAVKHDTQQKQ